MQRGETQNKIRIKRAGWVTVSQAICIPWTPKCYEGDFISCWIYLKAFLGISLTSTQIKLWSDRAFSLVILNSHHLFLNLFSPLDFCTFPISETKFPTVATHEKLDSQTVQYWIMESWWPATVYWLLNYSGQLSGSAKLSLIAPWRQHFFLRPH